MINKTQRTYLIIGANSDIAKCFIAKAEDVSFVTISKSKRANKFNTILKHYYCDLKHVDKFKSLLKKIFLLHKIDKVFCFHGLMSKNINGFYVKNEIKDSINVNVLSYAELLNFLDQKEKLLIDEIVLFGSIAGDRGKSKNPLYDGSKAFIHTLSTGYYRRFRLKKINLLLLKPGNVSSKMTNYQTGLLWSSPDKIAEDLLMHLDQCKRVMYVPFWWRYIMFVVKLLPNKVFDFLGLNEANRIR